MTADTAILQASKYAELTRRDFETNLKMLVDIPSISMNPEHKADIYRCAEAAAGLFKSAGAQAEVLSTSGNPIVIGQILHDPACPTVTIYNHLDVQPANLSDWTTAPFDMEIKDGIYRGRGSTDDKGPALTAFYAALHAREQNIPINIKFIWELEEEIGSPSFAEFLKINAQKLKCNSVVVSDTIWVSRNRPAIPYALRGLLCAILRLKTAAGEVHSGLAGGLARNPIGELCQLISQCYDAKSGHVNIPGFYAQVRNPGDDELDNFMQSGFNLPGFLADYKLKSVRSSNELDAAKRIWSEPTFEVHGIVGGYSGPGVKTIVPHQAEAKISMRLVPDQDPEQIMACLAKFIAGKNPDVEVQPESTLRPYAGDLSGPHWQAARQAVAEAFGKEPAFVREGGSIGAVVSMHDILKVPIIFLGLSLPEHGYHAVNEYFDWQQASGGIAMFTRYFQHLSQIATT